VGVNPTIERLTVADAPAAIAYVQMLLTELGEEAEDSGQLDIGKILAAWRQRAENTITFVARDGQGGDIIGITTVVESFAIYANGPYGIINEMYVIPAARSAGVGGRLIDAIKALGKERGWSRIDVTAPESERWARTRRFYEARGFTFAGPKLKFALA
jgi:GNAT superfamily N-acetyltransferase